MNTSENVNKCPSNTLHQWNVQVKVTRLIYRDHYHYLYAIMVTGHSDGMCSFIDDNVVVVADYGIPEYNTDDNIQRIKNCFPGLQVLKMNNTNLYEGKKLDEGIYYSTFQFVQRFHCKILKP